MKSTLIDAGPIIALFDKSDSYHSSALDFIKEYEGVLLTTWPVITEASHMLSFSTNVQIALLEWIHRGGLQLVELEHQHLNRIIELSRKYDDVPMDLADASLIVISELTGIDEVASIDADFYIYKNIRNQYLTNTFPRSTHLKKS